MNHRIASNLAIHLSTFALASVVVAGCGQAFSLTSGGGGNGGEASTTASSATTTAASTTGSGATTSSGSTGSSSASSSSATSSGSGMLGCAWNPQGPNPCPQGFYCDDTSCGVSVTGGMCKPKSVGKTGDNPVCGCDGLTYWSSTVAALRGMPARHNVACPSGADTPCDASQLCPGGAGVFCRKSRKNCVDALGGACWVLPGDCAGTTSQVETCPAKNCVNECALIKQGGAFDQSCSGG